jgi:ferritin-like metal-binding protein YciE
MPTLEDQLMKYLEDAHALEQRAGDIDTADVARRNRPDEQAMAEKIACSWDRVVELGLREEGVTA